MQTSITRKFLVGALPTEAIKEKIANERFYLYSEKGVVIRVQAKGGIFELERKKNVSNLVRESSQIEITQEEFDKLKHLATTGIARATLTYKNYPNLVVRVYEGKYQGLIRAEVSFASLNEARNFTPYSWFGKEITDSPLSKDSCLLTLSQDEFSKLLE